MFSRYMIGIGVVLLHLALVQAVMRSPEPVVQVVQVQSLVGRFEVHSGAPPAPPASASPPSPAALPKTVRNEPAPAPAASAPSTAATTARSLAPVGPPAEGPAPQADSAAAAEAPAVQAPVVASSSAAASGVETRSAAPRTVSIGEVQYLRAPVPVYPSRSERLRETGEVLLKVLIGTDGHPTQVTVVRSSGFEALDRAAVQAMKAALFKPYSADGVPQSVWVQTPISFQLESHS